MVVEKLIVLVMKSAGLRYPQIAFVYKHHVGLLSVEIQRDRRLSTNNEMT